MKEDAPVKVVKTTEDSDVVRDDAEAKVVTAALDVLVAEGARINADELDLRRLHVRDADARLQHLNTLVTAWKEQQTEERKLRMTYAKALIGLLTVEVIAIFAAFFLVGLDVLKVERWMAQIFLVTAFAQSASLVVVVVKYLFPHRSSDLLKLIEITSTPKPLPKGDGEP